MRTHILFSMSTQYKLYISELVLRNWSCKGTVHQFLVRFFFFAIVVFENWSFIAGTNFWKQQKIEMMRIWRRKKREHLEKTKPRMKIVTMMVAGNQSRRVLLCQWYVSVFKSLIFDMNEVERIYEFPEAHVSKAQATSIVSSWKNIWHIIFFFQFLSIYIF